MTGARVKLVDVDPDTWNATPTAYAGAITDKTKVIIAIDQFGNPTDYPKLEANAANVPIIEDAACAIGSTLEQKPCGSFGSIACLSFHPRKVITTGEGGACLTDDDALAARLRVLRNHGQDGQGGFTEPAANFRMTEIAAAIGLVQLQRLDEIVARRQAIADRYRAEVRSLTFQTLTPCARSNYQTMGALMPPGASADDRDQLVSTLANSSVQAGALSYALSRIGSLGHPGRSLPSAEDVADRGLALPLYPTMTDDEQSQVINAVNEACR